MKASLSLRWFHFAFLFCAFPGQAQTISNVRALFADGHVTITYDLTGGREKQLYSLKLYSSLDNFNIPLKLVYGDVGNDVKGGTSKKIEWNAASELGDYKGTLSFRIAGSLIPLPLNFINPTGGAIRRGKKTIIEWEGGMISNSKDLELYRDNERVTSLGKMKGAWQYTWTIPKQIKKGKNYTLKLSGDSESVVSGSFAIKPRIPLLLKLSPLVVVAAVISFFGRGDDKPEEGTNALPGAPNPE